MSVSRGRRRRYSPLTRRDRLTLALMVGIPTFVILFLVALPTVLSIILSFTSWNGIGGVERIQFVGLKNYQDLVSIYPPFFPALTHNLIWLGFFILVATPLGMFMAVLLDKSIRGTRVYQSALYLPVVLSLAIVGFIWQLQYGNDDGLHQQRAGHDDAFGEPHRLAGRQGDQPLGRPHRGELAPRGLRDGAVPRRPQGGRSEPAGGRADRRRQRAADVPPRRLPGAATDQHRDPCHHGHRVASRIRPRVHHQQGPERPGAPLDPRDRQHHRRGEPRGVRVGDRGRAAAASRSARSSSTSVERCGRATGDDRDARDSRRRVTWTGAAWCFTRS